MYFKTLNSNSSCGGNELTPLDILTMSYFYKGIVTGDNDRTIPTTFIIVANNYSYELINLDKCPNCAMAEIEAAMYENKWRPIAVEFCEDEEDYFELIDLYYFSDPSDEDIELIKLVVNDETSDEEFDEDFLNSEIVIGCPTHGYFYQKPKDHLAGYACPHPDCIAKSPAALNDNDFEPRARFLTDEEFKSINDEKPKGN
jgi:hypothetical protein